jgi:hypothetical protein
MGTFDSRPISLGELVQTLISHPYHGHKNKQETGIASKCQTGVASKYPMLRSAKQTWRSWSSARSESKPHASLPTLSDREDLHVEIQFLAEANLTP